MIRAAPWPQQEIRPPGAAAVPPSAPATLLPARDSR